MGSHPAQKSGSVCVLFALPRRSNEPDAPSFNPFVINVLRRLPVSNLWRGRLLLIISIDTHAVRLDNNFDILIHE